MTWRTEILTDEQDVAWDHLLETHALARSVAPMLDEQAGWAPVRIGLYAGSDLVGGAALGLRKVPGLPLRVARSRCIMVGPTEHADMLAALLAGIDRFAEENAVVEVELQPRIPSADAVPGFEFHRDLASNLADAGYRRLNHVERTYLVRIDRDDEALLGSFSKSCRKEVRRAARGGCTVSVTHDVGLLETLSEAHAEMCERKGAPTVQRKAIVSGLRALLQKGHALLFQGTCEGQLANLAIVDALGIPCAMLSTRTSANVRGEVTSAAQLRHFEVMRYLRDRGKTFYDLGGCEGPEPVKGHPNYGVWNFKYGFRGVYVEFMPYYRKARGPLTGTSLNLIHRLRGDSAYA